MGRASFQDFIAKIRAADTLAVQPRMGWGNLLKMRNALEQVKAEGCRCIGTLTLDSYTRVGDYITPLKCLTHSDSLNGYPLMSHPTEATRDLLRGLADASFPVQVRHGTPEPQAIFRRTIEVGLDASEGGPVSYCLPYGRTPLSVSVSAWRDACRLFADGTERGHIESFGGCLMGQLCPPSMLIAVSILECLFFKQYGIRSVSLSYAQGTSLAQDRAALAVLRDLADEYLGNLDWHVVVYTYMGLFPETAAGATRLLEDSASLAHESGCERLIVKTVAERRQIPLLADNLAAIRIALGITQTPRVRHPLTAEERALREELAEDVRSLLDAVLNISSDISRCVLEAFRRGLLDVPFCVHPDNFRKARAAIDEGGMLRWTRRGNLPVRSCREDLSRRMSSDMLLKQLSYVARNYDRLPADIDDCADTRGMLAAV